jgi:(p)ppGpp synthase/HD superfamily hydrolase
MDMALTHHTGIRKDGITPEVSHQFELVSYDIPLFENNSKELLIEMVCGSFLHDIVEDCGISIETIKEMFGENIADMVFAVTKPKGFKKTPEEYVLYYKGIEENNYRGILKKMTDRLHNLSTMIEANSFDLKKRKEYISEVMIYMIPTAKKVRRNYPEYYQKITFLIQLLKTYCKLIEGMNDQEERAIKLENSLLKPI